MEVRISGASKPEGDQFLQQVKNLLDTAQGPLRLSRISEKDSGQEVLFLRERTWGEFFLEKLIRTPQEIEDIENEALAAIELAFSPSISERRSAGLAGSIKNGGQNLMHSQRAKVGASQFGMDGEDGNDADNHLDITSPGSHLIKSTYKDELKSRVLQTRVSDDETESPKLIARNGLCIVPEGLSVSTCPALQVIAHNVIVGSVGAVSVSEIQPYSPLERAVKAFKRAWRGLETKSLPLSPATGQADRTTNVIVQEVLQRERGLRHIQKLMCIADDRRRNRSHRLAKQKQDFWKKLYLQGFETMEGSVVRELYPDYYVADRNAPGGKKPVYSDGNIKGAVAAAAAMRAEQRKNGKEPVSIMFAGMDEDTYKRMSDELKRIDTQRGRVNAAATLPEKLPEVVLRQPKFKAM